MVCWGRTNHWAALIVREGNQSGTMCTIPSLKRLSNPSQKRFSSLKIPLFSSRAVVMIDEFNPDFYQLIIAIPDWLASDIRSLSDDNK